MMETVGAYVQNAERETSLLCLTIEPFRPEMVGKHTETWRTIEQEMPEVGKLELDWDGLTRTDLNGGSLPVPMLNRELRVRGDVHACGQIPKCSKDWWW